VTQPGEGAVGSFCRASSEASGPAPSREADQASASQARRRSACRGFSLFLRRGHSLQTASMWVPTLPCLAGITSLRGCRARVDPPRESIRSPPDGTSSGARLRARRSRSSNRLRRALVSNRRQVATIDHGRRHVIPVRYRFLAKRCSPPSQSRRLGGRYGCRCDPREASNRMRRRCFAGPPPPIAVPARRPLIRAHGEMSALCTLSASRMPQRRAADEGMLRRDAAEGFRRGRGPAESAVSSFSMPLDREAGSRGPGVVRVSLTSMPASESRSSPVGSAA